MSTKNRVGHQKGRIKQRKSRDEDELSSVVKQYHRHLKHDHHQQHQQLAFNNHLNQDKKQAHPMKMAKLLKKGRRGMGKLQTILKTTMKI